MSVRCRPSRPGEAGQVTLFGVGLVVLLLFVGGLSLDLWRAFSERRALAEVADAAAAAGANGLDVAAYRDAGSVVLDHGLAHQLALSNVAEQTDRASMMWPPSVVVDDDVVVVEVRGQVPLTLLRLFTMGEPFQVTVRAEASPRQSAGP